VIAAVVFDMDGVIVSSEEVWDEVREEVAREHGGRWDARTHREMMGMSTPEWSAYMHEVLGVSMEPPRIAAEVERRIAQRYRRDLPLLPGAREAVLALAGRWPLGLASSSTRGLIGVVLELAGLADAFAVTVSSEEVARGKPAPDVYLEALDRLGVAPADAAAVEDSASGLRAARAAGMRVIAVPNPHYPPDDEALELADLVLPDIGALTPEAVAPPVPG
jgi:HAD superfamily hydrolase (TIGR01509 family)